LRQEDDVQFAAVSVAPEQPAWTTRAGTGGTIEIAFASGVQLRINDHAVHKLDELLPWNWRKPMPARTKAA
jgi:hypothetical protein